MPANRRDRPPATDPTLAARRTVVPARAARSLWLSAAWTGVGTAALAAVIGIAAVAVCWLPASGGAGNARSAIHAGLLTFLAAVHGGVTVDGLSAQFVPLGMTLLLACLAWRAGAGLADVAADLEESEPGRLLGAAAFQAACFAAACAVAGRLATLGTSHVPVAGTAIAAFLLFLVIGGAGFVRWSVLGQDLVRAVPGWTGQAARAAAAVLAVYLLAGALLCAGSLLVHHGRVETLSAQVGGGWSGFPVLLLGALAAPNAAIAGASYLAGPGFAVGDGNGISFGSGGHGVLPAFPILGGVPSGGAGAATWTLAVLTLLVAGACAAGLVSRDAPAWRTRFADLGRAGVLVAVGGAVLGWQGGGSIGDGQLAAVGASPWQLGLAFAGVTLVAGSASLGVIALVQLRSGRAGGRVSQVGERLQSLAAAASTVADRLDERIEATHTVVEVPDDDQPRKGIVRSTLSSVANAVTTTEDERQAG